MHFFFAAREAKKKYTYRPVFELVDESPTGAFGHDSNSFLLRQKGPSHRDGPFWQFFIRFEVIFTVYKLNDMICFDYFLLMKFHFFQFYFPEVESVYSNRKYGYNIKSQLFKLLIIFPAASAVAAWICSLF